ncbi:MAG: hypothetical protein CMJ39_00380 [Phycisphaerae bacterium]|nr:hypothetical protein [Phycisphaerae bacterium]|tara:strand:+ start:657 stop:1091 length:435 start_codon:yes stop_codon:yes gene_type:complete
MKILLTVVSLLVVASSAKAVPVVPSFSMGKMTTHTETTQETTELIRSIDYNTGWSYSVSGHGVEPSSGDISVPAQSSSFQIDSETKAGWTQLNMSNKPSWKVTTPGGSFQFVESYTGPGVSNITSIDRKVTTRSITDTTSIFQR